MPATIIDISHRDVPEGRYANTQHLRLAHQRMQIIQLKRDLAYLQILCVMLGVMLVVVVVHTVLL